MGTVPRFETCVSVCTPLVNSVN